MSRFARSAALALALGCVTAAAAQTSGVPVETAPVSLSPEKQTIVKDYVKRSDMPAVDPGAPVAVGPGTVVLIPPGVRHRAVGRMTLLNVVMPPFDPADEWFD